MQRHRRYVLVDLQQLATWPERAPPFHLQLFDTGPVAGALVRVLATLDCSVDWIVDRDAAAEPGHARDADAVSPERIRRVAIDDLADHRDRGRGAAAAALQPIAAAAGPGARCPGRTRRGEELVRPR
ncbi:MAG: hypothetical protein JSR59_20700 [Proteobacteria bacterium]|nr:hypothetical protein [Pseudomonadota bacterium]